MMPAMREMFKKQGMAINFVDTDGDKKGNHYVVGFHGGEGPNTLEKVFDPMSKQHGDEGFFHNPLDRPHGEQVVTDPETLLMYQAATYGEIR